jgi:hypothetical protein
MYLRDAWYSRGENAHGRAVKACEYEAQTSRCSQVMSGQKIFGHGHTAMTEKDARMQALTKNVNGTRKIAQKKVKMGQ